jgi:hypothetical protein
MMQSGGMTPHQVLRAATLHGADAVGLARDLGSLEVGKLADLQVLDRNPLVDIHNTNSVRYVMKNGRLYDGNTLDEVWPRVKPLPAQWWWRGESAGAGRSPLTEERRELSVLLGPQGRVRIHPRASNGREQARPDRHGKQRGRHRAEDQGVPRRLVEEQRRDTG